MAGIGLTDGSTMWSTSAKFIISALPSMSMRSDTIPEIVFRVRLSWMSMVPSYTIGLSLLSPVATASVPPV